MRLAQLGRAEGGTPPPAQLINQSILDGKVRARECAYFDRPSLTAASQQDSLSLSLNTRAPRAPTTLKGGGGGGTR